MADYTDVPPATAGDAFTTRPDVAEQFDAGRWEFTPGVAAVFDDHVRQSVPHYEIIQDAVTRASDWLLPTGSLIADFGASTGTTVDLLLRRHPERELRAVLYDEAPSMLARAITKLDAGNEMAGPVASGRVEYHAQRVQEPLQHYGADLSLMLFLLQFLPWGDRVPVLRAAREASASTGALLVAEKVRPVDSRWAEIAHSLSHDWKADHGITDQAIRAKELALRGVLCPDSLPALMSRIRSGGWYAPEVLFRWHSWVLVGAFAAPQDGVA
jgi:tRNA (cmo5U34)-methyltransferase